jgi:hypothetical protein
LFPAGQSGEPQAESAACSLLNNKEG